MGTVQIIISTSHGTVAHRNENSAEKSAAEIIVGMQRRIRDFDEWLQHKLLVFIGGENQGLSDQGARAKQVIRSID